MALTMLMVVMLPLGLFFLASSRAFSSLSTAMHTTSRALVVMDRIADDLLTANLPSLLPAVPDSSSSVEFQRITSVVDGHPDFGNTIHVDGIPLESEPSDGLDNDQNGLVDEWGVRIWEDVPPASSAPGAEDILSIVCGNLAPNGILFTRQAGSLLIDMTVQEVRRPGEEPVLTTLRSGIKMRNNQ